MKRPPLRTMYLNAMQFRARDGKTFPGVKVVSYHIPKAAGTSMSQALSSAYGRDKMVGVYRLSRLGPVLSAGMPIWIPSRIEVIHGMFKPHPSHRDMFPNARFVTWVRDPLSRLKSLLDYWIEHDYRHDGEWVRFKAKYDVTSASDRKILLASLVTDSEFSASNTFYTDFFMSVDPGFFDFVGHVETLSEDTGRLATVLGSRLALDHLNKSHGVEVQASADLVSALTPESEIISTFAHHGNVQ